jgi:hypothetical protein
VEVSTSNRPTANMCKLPTVTVTLSRPGRAGATVIVPYAKLKCTVLPRCIVLHTVTMMIQLEIIMESSAAAAYVIVDDGGGTQAPAQPKWVTLGGCAARPGRRVAGPAGTAMILLSCGMREEGEKQSALAEEQRDR